MQVSDFTSSGVDFNAFPGHFQKGFPVIHNPFVYALKTNIDTNAVYDILSKSGPSND